MASHGIPRVSGVQPPSAQARAKELQQIEDYKSLVETLNNKIEERQYSIEVLSLCSKLLKKNPEYYTIWNHRRLIMQHQFAPDLTDTSTQSSSEYSVKKQRVNFKLISNDLDFLFPLLRKFPKCYWIWNYRLWLLKESSKLTLIPDSQQFWQQELGLASKMLSMDSRNFMGWGYRRTVVAALEGKSFDSDDMPHSMVEEEFEYTTRMIHSNLSNFSAWHNRSKLIPRLLGEREADDDDKRSFLDQELKLIQRALWADPNDQSLWFYHQFLMCTFDPKYASESMAPSLTTDERLTFVKKELENLREMLDDEENCKWIYKALIHLSTVHKSLDDEWPVQEDEIIGWISQLRTLDPLREGRWKDLEESVNL